MEDTLLVGGSDLGGMPSCGRQSMEDTLVAACSGLGSKAPYGLSPSLFYGNLKDLQKTQHRKKSKPLKNTFGCNSSHKDYDFLFKA
jgi:hypothetical protein